MRRLRIFTWHVHGHYLYYLSQAPHEFFIPVKPGRPPGYAGRAGTFPWPENVHEVPVEDLRRREFDLLLFQRKDHYLKDQFEILSEDQRRLPRIYLEHDCPREHPTDTRHVVQEPDVLVVHVTPFNRLMWDNGRAPTRVIEHGVLASDDVQYSGEIVRGLAAVNNLKRRGRLAGADLFEHIRLRVPMDLVGMNSEEMGGLGEIKPPGLPAFAARYRFFFHPCRYTSLGLAVCEAMMVGLPIVGLATTELATVVQNGVSGYVDTDIDRLQRGMVRLLSNPAEARRLGEGARRVARQRFSIHRFVRDWNQTFQIAASPLLQAKTGPQAASPVSESSSLPYSSSGVPSANEEPAFSSAPPARNPEKSSQPRLKVLSKGEGGSL